MKALVLAGVLKRGAIRRCSRGWRCRISHRAWRTRHRRRGL